MQSEIPASQSQVSKPILQEILGNLKQAESPLDFIRSNLRPQTAEEAALPQETVAAVEAKRAEEDKKTQAEPPPAPPEPSPAVPKAEEPKVEEPKVEVPAESAEPLEDKEENFSAIRKKLSATNQTLKEKEKAVTELTEKLKKYEAGEEIAEPVKQKLSRVAELERYERLHAVKTSPAYKEKYVKPLEGLKSKLSSIAQDYGLPEEVMGKALNLTNRRELNEFLAEHFDEIGALEAKQVITEMQTITADARKAEAEPSEALKTLEAENERLEAARRQQTITAISEASKGAWVSALEKIRQEGKIKEFILKENDPEYNKNVVAPISEAAGKEFGKIVKQLIENGLTKLPEDVSFALSRMTQLAHASALAVERAEAAERELQEIKQNMERNTRYVRPPLGGVATGGGTPPSKGPASPTEAADVLLNSILSRK